MTGDVMIAADDRALIALSRDGRTVAVATHCDVHVFNALKGHIVESIRDVHTSASDRADLSHIEISTFFEQNRARRLLVKSNLKQHLAAVRFC